MSQDNDHVEEVAQPEEEEEEQYHSRIIVKPNGEVLIENLSIDLMELALMLDPEAQIGCSVDDEDEDDD